MRLITIALLPALAACASTGDYPGARPAPAGYATMPPKAPARVDTFDVVQTPQTSFVVTAPGPTGAPIPYHVNTMPGGNQIITPGVVTTGPWRPITPLN